MHHPLKHILVDDKNIPVMIDFERCNKTENPKNVTQFVEAICRMKKNVNSKKLRELAKQYKENKNTFNEILNHL